MAEEMYLRVEVLRIVPHPGRSRRRRWHGADRDTMVTLKERENRGLRTLVVNDRALLRSLSYRVRGVRRFSEVNSWRVDRSVLGNATNLACHS